MIANPTTLTHEAQLFGLVELDTAGTVLYSRSEEENTASSHHSEGITGRNFFSEVAPFHNTEEFQRRFNNFINSSNQAAHSFNFTCRCDDDLLVPVRVLLARIHELSNNERTKSILVHIRKAA
jgi:photoactive yellow protein